MIELDNYISFHTREALGWSFSILEAPTTIRTQVLQSVLKFRKFHSFWRMEIIGVAPYISPLSGISS